MTDTSTELDNPWTDIIERYFETFMAFFFPQVHKQIDWIRSYELLEPELQTVIAEANVKPDIDKLLKVWLKNGKEAVFYIRIKVQGQRYQLAAQKLWLPIDGMWFIISLSHCQTHGL